MTPSRGSSVARMSSTPAEEIALAVLIAAARDHLVQVMSMGSPAEFRGDLQSLIGFRETVTRDLNVDFLWGHQNDGCEEDPETMRRPGIDEPLRVRELVTYRADGSSRPLGLPFGSKSYSVVRFLKECAASGQATARIATDQISAASTGCCIGHACTMAEGFGLPHRSRAPATTALTGFQFATACSQPGMCWVGTKALETKVRGEQDDEAERRGGLRALGVEADTGRDPTRPA